MHSIQQIPMIKQQHPPTQTEQIQIILQKLNVKSIDEILLSDNINVDFLAKSTNIHKNIVIKLLFQLQELINQPEEIVSTKKYSLDMKEIVGNWAEESGNSATLQKLKDVKIGSSQVVEIIGRSNGGKSYFCFEFCLNCLQKGLTVIFLDSNQNYERLCDYIKSRKGKNNQKQVKSLINGIINFKFRTLSQFTILLHNLGNQLILQRSQNDSLIEKGVITVIDCLSRIQMADPDTDEQNSTMDFDIIERIKRLIVTYSTRVSTIVYTNRIPTATTLFNTYYSKFLVMQKMKNIVHDAKTIMLKYGIVFQVKPYLLTIRGQWPIEKLRKFILPKIFLMMFLLLKNDCSYFVYFVFYYQRETLKNIFF